MVARPNTLRLLTPPLDNLDAERFTYPDLESAVAEHYSVEYDELTDRFMSVRTEKVPLDDLGLAPRHLAVIALKLQQSTSRYEQELWGNAYTDTSVRLYGRPDESEALSLLRNDLEVFEQEYDSHPRLRTKAVRRVLDTYAKVSDAADDFDGRPKISYEGDDVLLRTLREALEERHGHVYAELDIYDEKDLLDVGQVYVHFEAMLETLKQDNDVWSRWKVVLTDGAQMSVSQVKGEIRIGKAMPPLPALRVRSLFTHEVLVHAQRGANGRRYNARLGSGGSKGLKAEEGLGGLLEGAAEGKMPYRFGDRYVDVALALGLAGQQPMTRPNLAPMVHGRTLLRRAAEGSPIEEEFIRTTTDQHVARIYRGTLGIDTSGVFTRDSYYYRGYREMAYQFKQLPPQFMSNLLDLALSGKIDISEASQRRYLNDHKIGRAHTVHV